ncbi:MAG: hypothetical protein KAQ93_09445, partial [Spirochaetales bacterium]|nr:hypothetical protein [Spirochaetales bacterium]
SAVGILDPTFNSTGYVIQSNTAGGNRLEHGHAIDLDLNGKILVTGHINEDTNEDMALWRYNSNGTLDTSFNSSGFVVHNNAAGGNGDDLGSDIAVDTIGRILITGHSYNSLDNDMVIWRYR